MLRFQKFVQRHRIAFALTFLVVLLHGGHHFFIARTLGEDGLPYYPALVNSDEGIVNGPHAHHIAIGEGVSGDTNLAEYADTPAPFPVIPSVIMSVFENFFGSIHRAFIAGDFIFPALTFFLFYLIGFEFFGKKLFALGTATFSIFLPRFFAWFPLLTKYYQAWLLHYVVDIPGRLPFDRFEDPQFTVPFFALSLYLFVRAIMRRERVTIVLAGLSFGILFYVYFYYWTYMAVGIVLYAGFLIFAGDRALFRQVATMFGLGLLVSIPYWINFASVAALPAYADFVARVGPVFTHLPFLFPTNIFTYFQHIALAIALLFLAPPRHRTLALFFSSLLLVVFVVMNFQIITGYNPQPDHWIKPRQIVATLAFLLGGYWVFTLHRSLLSERFFIPFFVLAGIFLAFKSVVTESGFVIGVSVFGVLICGAIIYLMCQPRWKEEVLPRVLRYSGIILIVLLFVRAGVTQMSFAQGKGLAGTVDGGIPVAESYEWLTKHTPKGSVVGSISFLTMSHIPLLTNNKVFIPFGINTLASDAEISLRFFIINKLYGVSPEDFKNYFATPETYPPESFDEEGISYLFTDKFRASEPGSIFRPDGYLPPTWSEEARALFVGAYQSYEMSELEALPYRLDYFYYGPAERAHVPNLPPFFKSLKKVFENEEVSIYAFSVLPDSETVSR